MIGNRLVCFYQKAPIIHLKPMGSIEFWSKSQKKTLCVVLGEDGPAFTEKEVKSFEFNDSTPNVF